MSSIEYLTDILKKLEIPGELADDLVKYFLQIADELKTKNLEKSSAGKFVETIVQIFQSLDPQRSDYDKSVKNVDYELNNIYNSRSIKNIPDESRIAIARVARAIYCLRSKRSMVHKNDINPNIYDLEFIYHSAQWIMTEFVRIASKLPLDDAKTIIEKIQRPVVPIIETIMGRPLVLNNTLTVEEEILLILYNEYSKESPTTRKYLGKSLDRRSSGAISNTLKSMWKKRLIEGNSRDGYRLTLLGVQEAQKVIRRIMEAEKNVPPC
jgi:hypothetical protein